MSLVPTSCGVGHPLAVAHLERALHVGQRVGELVVVEARSGSAFTRTCWCISGGAGDRRITPQPGVEVERAAGLERAQRLARLGLDHAANSFSSNWIFSPQISMEPVYCGPGLRNCALSVTGCAPLKATRLTSKRRARQGERALSALQAIGKLVAAERHIVERRQIAAGLPAVPSKVKRAVEVDVAFGIVVGPMGAPGSAAACCAIAVEPHLVARRAEHAGAVGRVALAVELRDFPDSLAVVGRQVADAKARVVGMNAGLPDR